MVEMEKQATLTIIFKIFDWYLVPNCAYYNALIKSISRQV